MEKPRRKPRQKTKPIRSDADSEVRGKDPISQNRNTE